MRDDGVETQWPWVADVAIGEPAGAEDFQTAFEFVRALAAELSTGRIDLPTAPGVASRVHQALEDDGLSSTLVTRVITNDPGLAANVLALANRRADARGTPITDLKLAVTRVGPDRVRSAALPYVLEKMRATRALEPIRADLDKLWEQSTLVAAIAHAIAARTRCTTPDVALLAGLLHNVGGVYLLARAQQHPGLFRSRAVRDVLMHDWLAPIGKAIAENWGLPDEIAEAIGDQDQLERHAAGERDLTDVLCVAARAASFLGRPDELEIALASLQSFRRLGLDRSGLHEVMRQATLDVARLRSALDQ